VTLPQCGGDEGEIEALLVEMINDKRASLGLSPLAWSDAYHAAAHIRCKELPFLYEHARPDGRTWYSVFEEVGLPTYPSRENLDYGQNTSGYDNESIADALYTAWINSPDHYANIVATDVDVAAICVIFDGSDVYAAHEFGKKQ